MEVGQAVIDRLVANGIDTLFGIPGTQTLPLNEAIASRDDVEFVVARHETAVSHQAWGYAETSGDVAGTVVVPGPGDMNAMNGLKNALNDCTPLVHIAVETSPEIRGGDGIHETPPGTYDTVVKDNRLVEQPAGTLVELEQAIATARTPPKGPVVLAGGGVRAAEASTELLAVADRLNAPIVTTYKGKGTVPDGHGLVAGSLSGSAPPELLASLAGADALLAVGTDLDAVATRSWSVDLPEDLVHVTLAPADLGTGYTPTVGVVADAAAALAALHDRLEGCDVDGDGRVRAGAIRDAFRERIQPLLGDEPPVTSVRALRAVREELPAETVVAVDAGGFRVWALNAFEASGPRRYVNPGSWATMGTGLPAGIGAQCSNPEADVVVLTGDGGLLMCLHELHTAAAENLPVTVVVFNNSDYAIISEAAARDFDLPGGAYGWEHAPLEFTTIAGGMGVETMDAAQPAEIRERIAAALATERPTLVEIPTDPAEPQASTWLSKRDDRNDY